MQRNYTLLLAVVLGAALVVGGVAIADVGSTPANAASNPDDPSSSTIHVSASGSAATQPDKVVVRLAIEATAENATVARQRVAENVSAVRSALLKLGMSADQIRTVGYNLYQDERRIVNERPVEKPVEKTVYRVSHELVVEVDDVESAGAIIDTAVANGATNIYDIRFTLNASTRERLRSKALSQAMSSARSKARTLASSANLTIVNVRRITTVDGGYSPERAYLAAATPTAGAGGDTDISSGPVTVTASVQVTYNATG